MNIEIPALPVALLTLLAFLAPYGIGILNGVLPFVKTPLQRKILAVVVAVVLAAVALVGYFAYTGTPLPSDPRTWVGFILLVLVVSQTSYSLVTKRLGADQLEQRFGGDSEDVKAGRHLSRANGN
jgi:hypothetical protein